MPDLPPPLEPLDRRITRWCADHAILALRISVGICFLWFGALKFFPGLSPAEDLATRTILALTGGLAPAAAIPPTLAAWECAIGLGMLSGRFLRTTLLLLAFQLPGTMMPLVLFPGECFTIVPIAPTIEGQYIIKNLVLAAAGIAVAATVRGARIAPAG